jgi:hypothetical protein
MLRDTVYLLIDKEREHQDAKWGDIEAHPLTVGEWLLVLEAELDEAKRAWAKNTPPPHSDLDEIRQIAAVAVACLEQHGCPPR